MSMSNSDPILAIIAKNFGEMDSHEKAAVALSFTQNNQSSATIYAMEQHLIRSNTK
ncbi:hypothetical protein N0398_12415 [Providencia rettgeri]|nr:hypothetical protein [Providencia rettgeri]